MALGRRYLAPEWPQFDDGGVVGVFDQNAPDAILPEFAKQAPARGVCRAVENGTEQATKARVGRHHFEP